MGLLTTTALTFDDVLIKPCASAIEPSDAILKTEIARGLFLALPILSAAMDRVTEVTMAIALGRLGGLGILHRNCSIEDEVVMVKKIVKAGVMAGAACGPFDLERSLALEKAGAQVIVVDCAHGHNLKVVASVQKIRKQLSSATKLIAGNIATAEAVRDLAPYVDAVKVGVGPGSICTTRIVSGVGVPQLTAIIDVARTAKKLKIPVIADGGIKTSGDVAKALAAGANAVMLGNMLAGTDEAPGKVVVISGTKYKEYRGMGSRAVLAGGKSGDRYLSKKLGVVPEGVEALVKYKGPVEEIIHQVVSGVKIAMGYTGSLTIAELQKRAKFIQVTEASLAESHPHSLGIIQ